MCLREINSDGVLVPRSQPKAALGRVSRLPAFRALHGQGHQPGRHSCSLGAHFLLGLGVHSEVTMSGPGPTSDTSGGSHVDSTEFVFLSYKEINSVPIT